MPRERETPVPAGVRARADYVLTECIKDGLEPGTKDRIISALWRHNLLARARSPLAGEDPMRDAAPPRSAGVCEECRTNAHGVFVPCEAHVPGLLGKPYATAASEARR